MKLTAFSLPLARPLETARGEITEREGFVVTLDPESDEVPARGVGEATPLPGWTESLSACRTALEQRAAGENDTGPHLNPGIPASDAPAARHGVSLALMDATARSDGVPLSTILASEAGFPSPAETVPVNATVGDDSAVATATAALSAVESGYHAVKVKVGARALDEDVERLRAVRDAVGENVRIRADVNGAWDRETARRALPKLAAVDVAYVEQPLEADDLAGHAMLRAESSVDVALDETLAQVDVETVLDADAADVLVLKPMALGGPDRAVEAARAATEADVEPVVTTTIDAVVARTAAVHVAAAIPEVRACGLATGDMLASDLASDPAPIEGGSIDVPEGPGIAGTAFDEVS
ncbi:MAG: mandelate racemase/muconate lactonizing enzyme family protein [Halopenitus sp.]